MLNNAVTECYDSFLLSSMGQRMEGDLHGVISDFNLHDLSKGLVLHDD